MKVPMKTKQINTGHIILASASPRRKELLDKAGLAFDVRPADIDEDAVPYAGDPAGYTQTLSTLKASAVAKACPDAWVIGADTIVVADNNILGKPKDRADAIGMLAGLAGRSHFVYTGFCIVHWTMGIKTASAVETQVEFKTLTDEEVAKLTTVAERHGIPLMIDNAYGAPFPNVIFTEIRPVWNENIILTLSLSKLGLPGTRTGIVIARPEVVRQIESMNSIVGLANPNIGQAIATPLMESDEVLRMSDEVIRPYYRGRSEQAQRWVSEFFDHALPWRLHLSEGAFFLWLWLEDCPLSAKELYRRLKQRSVFVVPGHYFFFGLEDDQWQHRNECMRISFAADEESVREGLRIIADEVARAYRS